MSLITSGLTWQVDFTNQSSLIISTNGFGNPQIDKATNLSNPSLFFSGISGSEPLYVYSGFSGPLGFSGTAQANGGNALTNKLGDYGSFTEYTMFFMVNNTGGTFNQFITSPNDSNYLGQSQGYDWFESYVTTDPIYGGAGFFYRTRTTTSITNDLRASGSPNNWYVVGTRVYVSGSDIITDIWVDGVLTATTTTSSQTLITAVDPIFFITGRQSSPGDILYTEALFYDRKLDNTEITDNFDYFNQKYFGISSVTPTPTPTITQTPSVTPTNTTTPTNTPSTTPTNTPTPSVTPTIPFTPTMTPSVTPTPRGINFKTISDDFRRLADAHKQLNSYGLGDIDQISYWTQSRDKEENTDFQSPFYPLLYVVPSSVQNDLQYKTWGFNTLVMDIVERDLDNQVDVLSDTNQILQDVISQFRLSVTNVFGDYNDKYYLDDEVTCIPFLEKYDDLTNGWNGELKIKTMTPLDRCEAAYFTFTGTPIFHDTINFKTFHDDFRLLADHHKQINSFGFGALDDLSFDQELRNRIDNTDFQSPYFPLLYVVPSNTIQKFGYMTYEFNVIVMDIIERDLSNQVDVLSDTNQILDDVISQFRLSVTNSLGNFNKNYYLQNPVVCLPFLEKYTDLTGGWSAMISIDVMDSLDRCDAAFMSFLTPTPSVTPTNTMTPTQTNTSTVTPTNTETPTNTPTQTQTMTQTETSTPTPSVTQTNTPTVTETPTMTPSITPTQSVTPTNTPTVTPFQCKGYTLSSGFGSTIFNYTNCDGTSGTTTVSFGSTNICAIAGSVVRVSGVGNFTDTGLCTITPTPTRTPTMTPTPSITPSGGGGGNKLWNTNTTLWNNETGLWNTV